jgi:hypothetical protein
MERPGVSAGEIVQETIGPPPDEVGEAGVIAESTVKTNGVPLYEIEEGATSFTIRSIVAVVKPPVLVAVIV